MSAVRRLAVLRPRGVRLPTRAADLQVYRELYYYKFKYKGTDLCRLYTCDFCTLLRCPITPWVGYTLQCAGRRTRAPLSVLTVGTLSVHRVPTVQLRGDPKLGDRLACPAVSAMLCAVAGRGTTGRAARWTAAWWGRRWGPRSPPRSSSRSHSPRCSPGGAYTHGARGTADTHMWARDKRTSGDGRQVTRTWGKI